MMFTQKLDSQQLRLWFVSPHAGDEWINGIKVAKEMEVHWLIDRNVRFDISCFALTWSRSEELILEARLMLGIIIMICHMYAFIHFGNYCGETPFLLEWFFQGRKSSQHFMKMFHLNRRCFGYHQHEAEGWDFNMGSYEQRWQPSFNLKIR